jgi:uncharacterized repeat protein (TIGR02543 family)
MWLSVLVFPSDAADTSVFWESENSDVATVSSVGTVTGKSEGTTRIFAASQDNSNAWDYCEVTVSGWNVAVSVEPNELSLDLLTGPTARLSAIVSNAPDTNVTWHSDDPSVAEVSSDGTVTAKAKGETTVTATSVYDTNKAGTCKITVTESEIEYTVTFDANGGSVSQSSLYGSSVTLPTPTRSITISFDANGGSVSPTSKTVSCEFSGWFTAASDGVKIGNAGDNYIPSDNITLYAQFYAPMIGALPTPTWNSGTFMGWYPLQSGGDSVTENTVVDTIADLTLYAQWRASDSQSNGGGGSSIRALPDIRALSN